MNSIQDELTKIAEELDDKDGEITKNLREMIESDKDKFVKIAINYKNITTTQRQFKDQPPGKPDKDLHDKIFRLFFAIESLKPSQTITSKLIEDLKSAILHNFAI